MHSSLRTSPYAFQGLGSTGLDYLVGAKKETGLPIVSELMSADDIDEFNEKVDLVQIGARNMQNFTLLKEEGARVKKPILLKRGIKRNISGMDRECRIYHGKWESKCHPM